MGHPILWLNLDVGHRSTLPADQYLLFKRIAKICDEIYDVFNTSIVFRDGLIGHSDGLAMRDLVAKINNAVDGIFKIVNNNFFESRAPVRIEIT